MSDFEGFGTWVKRDGLVIYRDSLGEETVYAEKRYIEEALANIKKESASYTDSAYQIALAHFVAGLQLFDDGEES